MKKQQKNQKDKHWHGRIYYNPDDSRVFVQKRPGLWAWSINFANPRAWALGAGAAAVLAVLSFFLSAVRISSCSFHKKTSCAAFFLRTGGFIICARAVCVFRHTVKAFASDFQVLFPALSLASFQCAPAFWAPALPQGAREAFQTRRYCPCRAHSLRRSQTHGSPKLLW